MLARFKAALCRMRTSCSVYLVQQRAQQKHMTELIMELLGCPLFPLGWKVLQASPNIQGAGGPQLLNSRQKHLCHD